MFKFLHTADIHLDSPLLNLQRTDDVPRDEFRSSTRRAFDNIVRLAIEHGVAFVLIAGDLYDGDCADMQTPIYLRDKFKELGAHDIRVFIIHGNHDAQSTMKKAFALEMPDNVHVFKTDRPETFTIEELEVAIHAQGFQEKAVIDDLTVNYPDPTPGYLNIGMLHTSCGQNSSSPHDNYAPSTRVGLERLGYDYWALGHIHTKEQIAGPDPWIIYPGNPQGRHIGESGARSCVVATCDGGAVEMEEFDTDVVRWFRCSVDLSHAEDEESVVEQVLASIAKLQHEYGDGLPLAIRLELTGNTDHHHSLVKLKSFWDGQLRDKVLSRFDRDVWVEKIKFLTAPIAESLVIKNQFGDLAAELESPLLAETVWADVQPEFTQLLSTLPRDERLPDHEIDIDQSATAEQLMREAREYLAGLLLEAGGHE